VVVPDDLSGRPSIRIAPEGGEVRPTTG
jgi:hypothetical protein